MTINELSKTREITRVLVTGGAGSVGMEVLSELHRHHKWYEVKVLERLTPANARRLKPFRKEFRIIWGDLCDEGTLEKATDGIDFVIHLAAVIPPVADHKPEMAERVNVEGTKKLVRAVEKHSPGAFFLYTSSISVYGDRVYNPMITVSDPLLPSDGDEYARTKIRAEKVVTESRLKWSIFRLTAIMGPQTRLSPLFFHMPLDTSLEIATARDTGFALVEAIYHRQELRNRIFNLSGGEACRTGYREFLVRVFSEMGLNRLSLPEHAFAQRNFHCGYYSDSGQLEEILHFQQDTLQDYYYMLRSTGSKWTRVFNSMFTDLVRLYLLSRSDPRKARKKRDTALLRRFFYAGQAG